MARGSRREVGTLDPTFQMGKKLGKMPPFLVQKTPPYYGARIRGGPHSYAVRENVCKQTYVGNQFESSK